MDCREIATYARSRRRAAVLVLFSSVAMALGEIVTAAPGELLSHQKISFTEGGFTGTLDNSDEFGGSVAALGDLDGDGVGDLAVGAHFDDDGGGARGAVWVLFLNSNGTVKSHQKISDTEGGFTGILDDLDQFGWSVAALGDLDSHGMSDLAVGAGGDDDGGTNRGAVWVLFLNTDGTVKSHQKISETQGGFTGALDDGDRFGARVTSLGDLDGDDVADLAVGAPFDDDGGQNRGAVWILFLNSDGTVKSHQKISTTQGGGPRLDNGDRFGSVAALGDLDGDGVGDLGVGAFFDDDGGGNRGAVWILFLNANGTVKSHQKISDTEGGFTGTLNDGDQFGVSVASLGDLNGGGTNDLAVGAIWDDDGGNNRGAVWVLFLNPDGTVKSHQKISSTEGGFTGTLDDGDWFGISAGSLGDLDGDGVSDLAVGALLDDDGGTNRGAVWILFLDGIAIGEVRLDIKPGSCPNSFNRNSHGVLPVALVGTDSFDVTQVDLSSILLARADGVGGSVAPNEGPPGPHSEFEDVATPFDGELCDCHEESGDGILDLSMKFKTDDVVASLQLNDLPAGDLVELVVSGALLDGTAFSASDCIRLVPPGTPPGMLAVGSNLPGAWLDASPLDLQLDGGGFVSVDGDFERTYPQTTVVTLTAAAAYHDWVFSGWLTDGGLRPGQTIEITIHGEQQSVKALYAPAGPTAARLVP
ncbi:MAG: FG-GAP repeat protein [Planctomycetes bacterium]|nr:FG-GAP repeat protein [Planctomycetota bacterium]